MRDRLIELVKGTPDVGGSDLASEMIADHLLANGVTVQEWISVEDRLPEVHGKYLVRVPSKRVGCEHCIWLIGYSPKFGFYDADPEWGDIPVDDVTHWMPLPQPPKGE